MLPWTALAIGTADSLPANVATVGPGIVSRLIAGWPTLALLIAVKLLSGMLDDCHAGCRPAAGPKVPASSACEDEIGHRPGGRHCAGPGSPRRRGRTCTRTAARSLVTLWRSASATIAIWSGTPASHHCFTQSEPSWAVLRRMQAPPVRDFHVTLYTWQDSLVRSGTSRRGLRTAQSIEMRLKPPGPALLPLIVSCEPWTSGGKPLGCRRLS